MGGSRHIGFRALHVSLTVDLASAPGLTAGQEERTFSERYLLIVKLRNFDYVQEDTAMRRPLRAFISPYLWPRAFTLSFRTNLSF